jgi:hypothetical protein
MVLRIDSGFSVSSVGRYLVIQTNSRKFTLYSPTVRCTLEWHEALTEFYSSSPRAHKDRLCPTAYPLRTQSDEMEIFTTSSDYYTSLAIALLSARVEIFITAFMFSLELILTRPPLPPTRLDQIIQYKVNQGVKFYFLINKQVFVLPLSFSLCLCSASLSPLSPDLSLSLSVFALPLCLSLYLSLSRSLSLSLALLTFSRSQTRFSSKLKQALLAFGPNVQCLRHSDKSNDGTPLWHNERVVVIDRSAESTRLVLALICLP